MKENREGESPEYSRTAAGRGRFAFSVPQRGAVITHILRSPTAKINLSGDPTRPHPLASLRAAPVLADAAGRRTAWRGDLQCCITRRVYCSRIIHYKGKKKKKPPPRYFLEGRGRRGGDNAAFCYADRMLRQDGGKHVPRSNLCLDAEGWEEGTKDQGRHRCDLW